MGFNRDVIRRRRDEMHELGVRVRWAGRAPRLWKSVIKELQVAEELTRDNDVLTLTMCVNYGGRAEIADAARAHRPRGRGRPARPGQGRRADLRPAPLRPRAARRRPGLAHVGGAAALQLHALAGGVRRAGLHRRALARRRPPAPVEGDRDLRPPRPPLRRRRARTPDRRRLDQPVSAGGQVPKISSVWLTSANPCSAAIASVHRSTAGPSTSTVAPQARQTRWWWWRVRAAAVDRLAVLGAQHVDLAGVGERLQGAVDGGQPDGVAALARAARGSPGRSGSRRSDASAAATARRCRVGRSRAGRRVGRQCSS